MVTEYREAFAEEPHWFPSPQYSGTVERFETVRRLFDVAGMAMVSYETRGLMSCFSTGVRKRPTSFQPCVLAGYWVLGPLPRDSGLPGQGVESAKLQTQALVEL